jgi:hypothetical protein
MGFSTRGLWYFDLRLDGISFSLRLLCGVFLFTQGEPEMP